MSRLRVPVDGMGASGGWGAWVALGPPAIRSPDGDVADGKQEDLSHKRQRHQHAVMKL